MKLAGRIFLFSKVAEAADRGEWWAILFIVLGAFFLLFILACFLFFIFF